MFEVVYRITLKHLEQNKIKHLKKNILLTLYKLVKYKESKVKFQRKQLLNKINSK